MKRTETPTFSELLAPKDAELIALHERCEQLARTIEAKKSANATAKRKKDIQKFGNEERELAAKKRRIEALSEEILFLSANVSTLTWAQLLNMLIETEEHTWNKRQIELGNKELESYEGRYEDSYRDYKGWPLGASQDGGDFPNGGEGKYLNSSSELTFRVSRAGTRAFGALLRVIAREFSEDSMTPEQWDILFDGEVSSSKIYHSFPELVRNRLQAALAPEKVLTYEYLVFLTDRGFFEVPKEDYARALSLASVTQMSPKYRLKREYVEQRLLAKS